MPPQRLTGRPMNTVTDDFALCWTLNELCYWQLFKKTFGALL